VLVNLIGNALDAMPKGGRLIMRTRELTGKTGEKCVRLTIADTGVSMSSEVRSRVFEAFYTTKKMTGTGIGLWLSQEIIKKCGSKIHVKSTLNRGTVFSLYLPGLAVPPADHRPADEHAKLGLGNGNGDGPEGRTPDVSQRNG
jgi:signal transduction histidine kinase